MNTKSDEKTPGATKGPGMTHFQRSLLLSVVSFIAFALGLRAFLRTTIERLSTPLATVVVAPSARPADPDGAHLAQGERADGLTLTPPQGWVHFRGWPEPQSTTKPLRAFASPTSPPGRLLVFGQPPLLGTDLPGRAKAQLLSLYPQAKVDSFEARTSTVANEFDALLTWPTKPVYRGYVRIKSTQIQAIHLVYTAQAEVFEQALPSFKISADSLVPPQTIIAPIEATPPTR